MIKNQVRYPPQNLLLFIVISLATIIVGYLIGGAVVTGLYGKNILEDITMLKLSNPDMPNALWILQLVSTTIPIMAASLIFAFYIAKDPHSYLLPSFNFNWVLIIIVFCVMIISAPLIECLSNINQKLQMPPFLAALQRWMRQTEDQAQRLTTVLLQMNTVGQLIFRVLVVGLLTSIVEEFMFRGCVQTILLKWFKNPHIAIAVTAAMFSAFHMEFFGFLPRMMLGMLFGYFVYYSGSIWTAVWGHFINNGTAVVVSYLFQNKKITVNPDDTHIFNWSIYLFSLIIVLFLLYLYRNIAMGKKQSLQV
ncbi:MAG: CPBP family intramembrane glutamic endopeptidase [Bacteroidota bacterium]